MLIVITIVLIAFLASTAVFFYLAMWCDGANTVDSSGEGKKGPWAEYADRIKNGMDWFFSQPLEEVGITSYDGLKLCGYYLPAEGAKTTVILMHGYRSKELFDFSCIYRRYHELGYNLLVPYQRAHGKSQGKLICFGVKERYDCARWAEFISKNYPEQDIIIEGMSMGATTVLMAAGLKLPEQVKGVIADCGFTRPYDIMEDTMKRWKLPPRPYLDIMSVITRLIGFNMFMSTEDSLRNCKRPVLLIHGTADKIVPAEMSVKNFKACAGEKELVLVEGAGHGTSYIIDHDRCDEALLRFLNKYCKQREE